MDAWRPLPQDPVAFYKLRGNAAPDHKVVINFLGEEVEVGYDTYVDFTRDPTPLPPEEYEMVVFTPRYKILRS